MSSSLQLPEVAFFGEVGNGNGNENACRSPDHTAFERAAAAKGDRLGYWKSRFARGDPIARTALDILHNRGVGRFANQRLAAAVRGGSPSNYMNSAWVSRQMHTIGVSLMRQNLAFTDASGGMVTPGGVAGYHHQIFAGYGYGRNTFDGTPFFGFEVEAMLTDWAWFQCGG